MVERRRAALAQAGGRLRTLSPRRPSSAATRSSAAKASSSARSGAVVPGDPIAVEVADGSFGARVE